MTIQKDRYSKLFPNDESKARAFDLVAQNYYMCNFGSMSKSDLEVLMFSIYIERILDQSEENANEYSDYTLSKYLGISQSRIRALKEKKELKYPREGFAWEEAFAKSVANAKYDKNDHYVKMIIQDVNVMNEVRNFIERQGWYDECSLNKKLLRIPLDCFVEICSCDGGLDNVFSPEVKKNIKKIKNSESAVAQFAEDFTKDGLKSFLMSASKEAIREVLKLLPFGGIAGTAFSFLLNVLEAN